MHSKFNTVNSLKSLDYTSRVHVTLNTLNEALDLPLGAVVSGDLTFVVLSRLDQYRREGFSLSPSAPPLLPAAHATKNPLLGKT